MTFSTRRGWRLFAIPVAVVLIAAAALYIVQYGPRAELDVDISQMSSDQAEIHRYSDTIASCKTCSIRLHLLAQFGQDDDPALLRDFPIVERDSEGRFYATVRNAEDHEIIVYGADGRVIRSMSRYGAGPGEFKIVQDMHIGPGDTLYIAHDAGFISLFNPAGGFVRSFQLKPLPVPPYSRIVGLVDGGILLNAVYMERSRISADSLEHEWSVRPLHLFDASGQRIESFGPLDLLDWHRAENGQSIHATRISALALDSTIWLADMTRYRLEGLGPDGSLRKVLGVRVPRSWNPVDSAMSREEAEHAAQQRRARTPRPREELPKRQPFEPWAALCCMASIGSGQLAISIHIASPGWADVEIAHEELRLGEERRRRSADVSLRLSDTVIDILDVETGNVLARTRQPGRAFLTRDGTLIDPLVSADGLIQLRAYNLELVGASTAQVFDIVTKR